MTVTVVLERTGELREVRFAGPTLTIEGLRHVRVGELAEKAREIVRDWVVAYEADRPAEVRQAEAEARQLLQRTKHLGAAAESGRAYLRASAGKYMFSDIVEGFRPPARPGRAGRSDVELATAASVYVNRCVVAGEKVGAVAKSLGMQPSTFSGQIVAARDKGLLTGSPKPGQIAGALTNKAKQLLDAAVSDAPKEA